MRQNEKWGTELQLVGAAHVARHRIIVWTNGTVIVRYGEPDHPVIHRNYINGNHYNVHTAHLGANASDS